MNEIPFDLTFPDHPVTVELEGSGLIIDWVIPEVPYALD